MRIRTLIGTTVVRIRILIGTTVVRIASAFFFSNLIEICDHVKHFSIFAGPGIPFKFSMFEPYIKAYLKQLTTTTARVCLPCWSPYTQTNINIEAVQHRAARWIINDYSSYSSVTQMIDTLGWRSLEQRRASAARLIMFYKIVYGLSEISLPPRIQRQVRMTRNMLPYHFIHIHILAIKLLQILSFGHRAVEQPPF